MVLVTGPTGSGKTNTALLVDREDQHAETNIMTAEDPVEFNLAGINQVQVRENIGLNFARRARVLPAPGSEHHPRRRNPRLRDGGNRGEGGAHRHLVLSTLHTNDAPSTINRLMNMGIEPFLVASSVHLICAQRSCAASAATAPSRTRRRRQALVQAGYSHEDANSVTPMKGAGCDAATRPATRGASASMK
jgi:type IV pilus assembly protein PilB